MEFKACLDENKRIVKLRNNEDYWTKYFTRCQDLFLGKLKDDTYWTGAVKDKRSKTWSWCDTSDWDLNYLKKKKFESTLDKPLKSKRCAQVTDGRTKSIFKASSCSKKLKFICKKYPTSMEDSDISM